MPALRLHPPSSTERTGKDCRGRPMTSSVRCRVLARASGSIENASSSRTASGNLWDGSGRTLAGQHVRRQEPTWNGGRHTFTPGGGYTRISRREARRAHTACSQTNSSPAGSEEVAVVFNAHEPAARFTRGGRRRPCQRERGVAGADRPGSAAEVSNRVLASRRSAFDTRSRISSAR